MIAAIGLMLAGYIFAQLIEQLGRPVTSFRNSKWYCANVVFAILGLLGVVITTIDLLRMP